MVISLKGISALLQIFETIKSTQWDRNKASVDANIASFAEVFQVLAREAGGQKC